METGHHIGKKIFMRLFFFFFIIKVVGLPRHRDSRSQVACQRTAGCLRLGGRIVSTEK